MAEPTSSKQPMTDEERAELCKKLDDDLDAFMDELAKKSKETNTPRKPFDFDEWSRDLDRHPAFMTRLPEAGGDGEYSETIQALQALKYDTGETEEEKIETAEGHKMEGNKHFKLKKYRWAVEAYTNGITLRCVSRQLNAVLYANRAAAQKHLGNLRSAVRDCVFSRRFDPRHLKACVRGAECLLELGHVSEAIEFIEQSRKLFEAASSGAEISEEEEKQLKALASVEETCRERLKVEQRDARKIAATERRERAEIQQLIDALHSRGLAFQPKIPRRADELELNEWNGLLNVDLPQLQQNVRVRLENGELLWPVFVLYPDYQQTDFLTDCAESSTLAQITAELLEHRSAEWSQFRGGNLTYSIRLDDDTETVLAHSITLGKVLAMRNYTIVRGLPSLMIRASRRD